MSIKHFVKQIVYRSKYLEAIVYKIQRAKKSKCEVIDKGYGRRKIDVCGEKNCICIGENTFLKDTIFKINGNNNTLVIEENCYIGPKCSFWIEGDNSLIHIKKHTSFSEFVHLCAQENNVSIIVGEDCMFSNNIIVRTSDSHPIYDVDSNKRINFPQNVTIGNHVWIAPNSKVMKGATIGDGSIIGSDTLVTKDIPQSVLAVGHPAKVVKTGIRWSREELF